MNWDYCIVGAGVLGTATAKYLKEKDKDCSVLLIDQFPTSGQGNTIRSNAAYRNVFSTTLNIMLSSSTIDYFKSVEKSGENLGQEEIGYLFLLSKDQYRKYNTPSIEFNQEKISFLQFLKEHQVNYKIYNKSEIHAKFPEITLESTCEIAKTIGAKPIEYGLLGQDCGILSPDLISQHYLNHYRNSGGSTRFDTKVNKLMLGEKSSEFDPEYIAKVWETQEIKAIEIEVDDKVEYIEADKFIISTGAWINELVDPIGIRSRIKAKKRQLFTICNMDKIVDNSNFDNSDEILPFTILPTAGVFIKPLRESKCLVVGTSDDIGRPFQTIDRDNVNARDKLQDPKGEEDFYTYNILPVLQSYFSNYIDEQTQIKTPSAGHYAYSIDKNPVISQTEIDNLYICSGASGSGIMKSDAIARICSNLVTGEEYATLFNGYQVKVSNFGLRNRNLPHETLVL